MRHEKVVKIAAIHADTAEEFETKFNNRIDELDTFKIVERKIEIGG